MVEQFTFTPQGVCARSLIVAVEDGVIRDVKFIGGCPGNQAGVSRLVRGRPVTEIAALLRGIHCGSKATSCPDQLAQALDSIASHTADGTDKR